MFQFITTNGMWKWVVSCLEHLKVYFSAAFWSAFVRSPNFVIFAISAILFVTGLFMKKKMVRGLCIFWGIVMAFFALVEFDLVRF